MRLFLVVLLLSACNGKKTAPIDDTSIFLITDADGDGVFTPEDCNDNDPEIHPGATEDCSPIDRDCDGESTIGATDGSPWYPDTDHDGYGAGSPQTACEAPDGYVASNDDCNDHDPAYNPAAAELDCSDPNDYNCDGSVGYADNDSDGFPACADCDDHNASISPDGIEICDNQDNNCDGTIDEATATDALPYYNDQDGDGYGDPNLSQNACSPPEGWVNDATDCNDQSPSAHPGANEICDTIDNNCDAQIDEDSSIDAPIWFMDVDNDGYGDPLVSQPSCTQPPRYIADHSDCNDNDPAIYSGAPEYCNSQDDDCDGQIDNNTLDSSLWYPDQDQDGYGGSPSTSSCTPPMGFVSLNGDCDDQDSGDYPGATEILANGDDEDCDGTEICYLDNDQDGFLDNSLPTILSANGDCQSPGEAQQNTPTGDCDDQDSGDYPGATEIIGNNDDEDCDSQEICYDDADDDGYLDNSGNTRISTDNDCTAPYEGLASDPSTDCDDNDNGDYPGATEIIGNNDDEDCDGTEICYIDNDQDGYRPDTQSTLLSTNLSCQDPGEAQQNTPTGDCDDQDAGDYPGATEIIGNEDDEDCDGQEICYTDADHDGHRPDANSTTPSTDSDCQDPGEANLNAPTDDCNDNNTNIYPGATEVIGNNSDDNCDGTEICYNDDDNDGYLDNTGDTQISTDTDCQDAYEASNTAPTTDCNDNNANAYPGASETIGDSIDEDCDGGEICYNDADNDGYLDATNTTRPSTDTDCLDAYEGGPNSPHGDCNDANAAQNPGATEICDTANTDEDCDNLSDDADNSVNPATQQTWYRDLDNDSYGANSSGSRQACDAITGYVALYTDCDDSDAGDYPGASEIIGNNDDESCDGSETCYHDDDNDGFIDNSGDIIISSDTDCNDAYEADLTVPTTDCNDSIATINPNATESCNNTDDNCNGSIDEGVIPTWYRDVDTDTYGTPNNAITTCNQPTGYVSDHTDCNDNNSGIHPNATEICDGLDQDCNGTIDDGFPQLTWYRDVDNDNYGNNALSTQSCIQPTGYVADNTDCNDTLAAIHPGATEICDSANTDEDCDNLSDDADPSVSAASQSTYYRDQDGDNYGGSTAVLRCDSASGYTSTSTDCDDLHNTVYPGASEIARDTYDNDCDGVDDVYYTGIEALSNSKNNDHSSSITTWSRTDSNNTSLGSGLAGGMDITGDSYPDVLISDRNYDESSTALNYGLTYVMAGSATGLSSSLSTTTLQITDSNGGARSGTGIALISDISNDGYNDAILGAPFYASSDTGRVVVFKGGPTLSGSISQSNTSSVHITVNGLSSSDLLGYQVAALGDFISGGSTSDWALSAVAVDNGATTNAGAVYIINGSLSAGTYTGLTATTTGIIINGLLTNGYLGTAITTFDNNGDNDPDLLISAQGANVAGNLGSVYLFDGPMSTGSYTTADASLTLASYQTAFAAPNESISCIANAGDTNNDGYEDMLLGAPGYDSSRADIGSATLYLGSNTGISSPIATAFGSSALDNVGRSVSGAGDVDLDGYDDILIAAPSIGTNIGEVVLAYGPLSGTLNLNSAGALWLGPAANTRLGGKVSGVGDVNMDGWSDFMMSATGAVSTGSSTAYTYLVYGISQ